MSASRFRTVGSFAVAAVGVILVAGQACSSGRAELPQPGGNPVDAHDLVVRRARFEDKFLLTGQLVAISADNLSVPRIPSWQTTIRWMADEGALVKAGERVAEFDTAALAQEYGEKKVAFDQAQSDLAQAEADRAADKAEKEFQVTQKGIAVEKAKIAAEIPAEFLRGKEFQDNQLTLQKANTDLAKAREDLEAFSTSSGETVHQKQIVLAKAKNELDDSAQALEGMVLKAPRDGILVVADHPWQGRKLQTGDSVWVGLPVLSLPDLSTMQVEAKLSDVDDGRITAGLPVSCILDAYPDRTVGGKIQEITPVAQEAAGRSLRRAYNVRITLDAPDTERMRPGMSVKVEVHPAEREGVLLAPRAGLDLNGAAPKARLADGDAVEVKLGPCNRDACIVESGLAEGARLRRQG
jgi:multidrug resistance efflux pump